MTDAVEEIRQRAEAATPGPWAWRGNMDHDDPRLVGGHVKGAPGRRDVMGVIPRERELTDRGAREFEEYLRELQTRNRTDEPWRHLTDAEVAERIRDEWLHEPADGDTPRRDNRLTFCGAGSPFHTYARELAVYEVARAQGLPDDTPRDHPKVYRADIVDVAHPDAQFIAHARQDVETLLAELDGAVAALASAEAEAESLRESLCDRDAHVAELQANLADIRRQYLDLADERDQMRRARDAGWARVDRAREFVADLWHPEQGGPANRRELQRDLEAILGVAP